MDRVLYDLHGDVSDLSNLIRELEKLKGECNSVANQQGFALCDCDMTIEFKLAQL